MDNNMTVTPDEDVQAVIGALESISDELKNHAMGAALTALMWGTGEVFENTDDTDAAATLIAEAGHFIMNAVDNISEVIIMLRELPLRPVVGDKDDFMDTGIATDSQA